MDIRAKHFELLLDAQNWARVQTRLTNKTHTICPLFNDDDEPDGYIVFDVNISSTMVEHFYLYRR